MAVTPNYSWPVPVNTDYVKDGAEAIKDLGDAIDATVFGLPAGGLTLISTTTIGTAVSSVIVSGAFSATYDAYKIVITGVVPSAADLISLQLGAVTSEYYQSRITYTYAGVISNSYDNNTAKWTVVARGDIVGGIAGSFDLLNPFLSRWTFLANATSSITGGAGTVNGLQKSTTSVTAFTLTTNTGTLTGGTISIYGYRK